MKNTSLLLLATVALASCKKESDTPEPTPANFSTPAVLSAFTTNLAQANYNDLALRATALQTSITTFNTSLTDADLTACRQAWRSARESWERSEGMLFGPVSTGNIDPRIDTWPVNFTDLEAQLNSGNEFNAAYITALEDALKGFHPIEYLLFGLDSNKTAAQMTVREREYLVALCADLVGLTTQLATEWHPSQSDNYSTAFATAGSGSIVYATQRVAFEELVNAMAGICDEVANAKMGEPLLAQDPSLEESPYSQNSLTDFTNNIRSVENVYLGRYTQDGLGLEDVVRQYDLQLDGTIKQRIAASINALNNITVPYGEAIISQQVQVNQAIDAINALAATLNDELLPLVQQHIQ